MLRVFEKWIDMLIFRNNFYAINFLGNLKNHYLKRYKMKEGSELCFSLLFVSLQVAVMDNLNVTCLNPDLLLQYVPTCLLKDAKFEFPIQAEYEDVIGPLETTEIYTGIFFQFGDQLSHHVRFEGIVNNLGIVTKNKFFPAIATKDLTVSAKNFSTDFVFIRVGMPLGKIVIEPN